jgi:hypothetical protein
VASPLVNQPVASCKVSQSEANPKAGELGTRLEASKLKASPHLDVGFVELVIGLSSDEGISRGQIGGLLVQRREDVSSALLVPFMVPCYKKY